MIALDLSEQIFGKIKVKSLSTKWKQKPLNINTKAKKQNLFFHSEPSNPISIPMWVQFYNETAWSENDQPQHKNEKK